MLRDLDELKLPRVRECCSHVYYNFAMQLELNKINLWRDRVADMLIAEGVPIAKRYQNIHLLPVYQKKIAYGSSGFPWNQPFVSRSVSYEKGICAVAENLQDYSYMGLDLCNFDYSLGDIQCIREAFHKVWRAILTP